MPACQALHPATCFDHTKRVSVAQPVCLASSLCVHTGPNKGVIATRIEEFYGVAQQPPQVSQDDAGGEEAPQTNDPPGDMETEADTLPAEVGTAGLRWAIIHQLALSKAEM